MLISTSSLLIASSLLQVQNSLSKVHDIINQSQINHHSSRFSIKQNHHHGSRLHLQQLLPPRRRLVSSQALSSQASYTSMLTRSAAAPAPAAPTELISPCQLRQLDEPCRRQSRGRSGQNDYTLECVNDGFS